MNNIPQIVTVECQENAGQRPPATLSLPLIASRVLAVLQYLLRIGELGAVAQSEIARIGHISEASVSKAMTILVEHGFIERTPDPKMNGGHGGYWITLLPHPDAEGSPIDPARSARDPACNGSCADPVADDAESIAPMPNTPSTASQCEKDRQLIPERAVMDDHDACLSSSNMRAHAAKNDWAGVTIAGADFVPWQALEKAGVTPDQLVHADAQIRTRTEYDRPTQIRILFDCLLNHKPIASAADMARREEPRHERATTTGKAGTRRGSAPNRPARHAPSAPDPEYAAYLAECLAAPLASAESLGVPVPRRGGAAHGS